MRIVRILRPYSWMAISSAALLINTASAGAQDLSASENGNPQVGTAFSISTEFELQKLPSATSAPVITALAGSRDGRYLAAAGDDHAIRIIDTSNGKTIQTVLGHHDWIKSLLFVYPETNSNEQTNSVPELFSAGHDGRVLRWRYNFPIEAEEVAIVPYAIRSISITTQENLLAIGGFSDEVLIYDLEEGLYLHRLKCSSKDQRTVRFSPDGGRVLSGANNGEIQVWDSRTGESIATYREHQRRVQVAAFSADGNCITSAGDDRRVIRYGLSDHRVVWNSEIALSKMMSLCLINDDMVAVAGADNKVRLMDAQSESVIAEMSGHTGTVAVITTCGATLVTGSFDTTVRLWSLTNLENDRLQSGRPTSRTPITVDNRTQIR